VPMFHDCVRPEEVTRPKDGLSHAGPACVCAGNWWAL
jgi:hypothetical protein